KGGRSAGAGDLASLQALRAHVQPARSAVHQRPNALHVRIPPAWGPPMRVRDLHPEPGFLSADVADPCHGQGMVTVDPHVAGFRNPVLIRWPGGRGVAGTGATRPLPTAPRLPRRRRPPREARTFRCGRRRRSVAQREVTKAVEWETAWPALPGCGRPARRW